MNSIGQCDPVQFESIDFDEWTGSVPATVAVDARHRPSSAQNSWYRFPVCQHSDGMQAFFDVCVPGEGGTFSLTETETYRLLCHALLEHLPDAAFGEAVQSLTGMYEFYSEPLPVPAMLTREPMKARITGSYTAPVYPVTEE